MSRDAGLIHDKDIEHMRADGKDPKWHRADDDEYKGELAEKLKEEVEEFLEDEAAVDELVDILEVLSAICKVKGIDESEIESVRATKRDERGTFEERIILDSED